MLSQVFYFRFVLAATDHLRGKITRLEARLHSLEDALAIMQVTYSEQPHPLLETPFSFDEDEPQQAERGPSEPHEENAAVAPEPLGALHLNEGIDGASRFFGPSGGSEVRFTTM